MSDHEHNHDDEEEEIIILTDDEGKDHEFVIADILEVESKSYAILVPRDVEGDAVIFRLEESGDDEDELVDIEDDAEWERVVAAYEKLLQEEEE